MSCKHEARVTKVCGNDNCSISTGWANDELTFGRGDLDDYGYWGIPCVPCAQAWKAAHPLDDVWTEPARCIATHEDQP